jgi:uncharacterized membrane protein
MSSDVLAAEMMQGDSAAGAGALSRMGIALLSLAGLFVSIYLFLFKIGAIGSLACGLDGGCQTVQASQWAYFLGVPVAAYGVAGYLVLFGVAMAGIRPGLERDRRVAGGLLLLASGAFAFSVYLTALEAFVIHAWCRWCVVSAVLATLIFALALFEIPHLRRRKP